LLFNTAEEFPAGSGQFRNLPLEINYSKSKFAISKCNPIGVQSSTDAECNNGSVPYTKVFRIAVEIVLDDGIGNQRGLTFFDAVIKDPC